MATEQFEAPAPNGSAFTHPVQVADASPDRLAFVMAESGRGISYADLVRRSNQAAHLFRKLGVEAGDTVAFLLENCALLPELCWAAKNSGLYYVCISTQLNAEDFRYVFENSDARLLVTSEQMRAVASVALDTERPAPILSIDGEGGGFLSYEDMLLPQPVTPPTMTIRGASMLYSSGTTGRPKGVRPPLEHVSPMTPPRRHRMMVEDFAFEAGMVFLTPAPLYHAAPLRMMMAVQRLGGTVIAFSKFDEVGVLEAIPRFSATHGFFVPTMFVRMLRLPPESRAAVDLSSLRVAIHAAAPCPAPIKHRMIEWWGPVIYEVYGGTEAVGHTVISPQDWLAHPGSVGRPPAGCRLEVRDDAGRVLGPGETGLVYFANGNRFAYYKDAQKTAETCTVDGFATFGDIGHVDEAGYLYLTDRKADMIISGGVNIYPQEAERVLLGHPAVADVAIFGVPDEEFGEQVKALIETFEPPADAQGLEREILDYCRAHLSPIKCPRSVEFVDRLPRNDLGKIAKHELKRHYWRDRATLIV